MSPPWRALLGWALLTAAGAAQAHVASNGFLSLEVRGRTLAGSLEIAVRDAELAVGVDANHDGKVTWDELRASGPVLALYLTEHLGLSVPGGSCPIHFGAVEVNRRVDGNYAWLPLRAECPTEVRALEIRYQVLSDLDPSHRGLLRFTAGGSVQSAVLGTTGAPLAVAVDRPSRWRTFAQYFEAGTRHIWSGIDHLLFLLSLLLPAVLVRREQHWMPVHGARPALWSVLKVVTAFTIAHSITLTLAALDVVHLPSRLTESVIAASIIVAALNNIFPVVTDSRASIAFSFGLLHGFGFASVLADMGLPSGARMVSLVAFNTGIEAGQLAVVVVLMPIAYTLRTAAVYRRAVLPWGSAAIATLAFVWLVQRALFPG